jgi:hypothetical protein
MTTKRRQFYLAAAIVALVGNAPPDDYQDAFPAALAALQTGSAAEARGHSAKLRRAAQILAVTGAYPLEGDSDLSLRWLGKHGAPDRPSFRNRALGPAYRRVTLNGGLSAHFEQVFLAGQRARVAIVPVGDAAFGLAIADDNGQSICGATAKNAQCDWVPVFTSRFRIDLQNASTRTASYIIVMQ